MKIGHALKICRVTKNISLDELANKASMSQSYLSMIETGKRQPTLSGLEKISNSLNISLPILLLLAAEKDELKGLDEEVVNKLSTSIVALIAAQ